MGQEAHIVTTLPNSPGQCVASGRTEGEFIDTGVIVPQARPYIYLHRGWVEEQAEKLFGMVSEEEQDRRFVELEARVAEQDKALEELHRLAEAIEEVDEATTAVFERMKGESP